jgi:hypothetical protein
MVEQRCYLDDVPNIRGYIARLRTIIAHHIDDHDLGFYMPQDTTDKSRYYIAIERDKITIRTAAGEMPFEEFPLWKRLRS